MPESIYPYPQSTPQVFIASFEISLSDKWTLHTAHCLYVLTEENTPAILEVRSSASHLASLLEIAQVSPSLPNGKSKGDTLEPISMLKVLVSG